MLKIFYFNWPIRIFGICIYIYSCALWRVSWDSPVIPFIETFILILGRIDALRLFCGTWNDIIISVDNLLVVISSSLSGT